MKNYCGLSSLEANEKIKLYGYNELKEQSPLSVLKIFWRQFSGNFVIFLLLAGTIISFFVGKTETAYTVIAVIFAVVIVGFIQEFKAEKSIKALKKMIMPMTMALRDGKETEVPSRKLVPEDVVILRTGEKIPADCLVLEQADLEVNESMLTGESKEVPKTEAKSLKDRASDSLIYMGSLIVSGKCKAMVLHTGMNTEFGKIASLISQTEKELPLQKKVNDIAKIMTIVAVLVSVLVGAIMLNRHESVTSIVLVEALVVVIALSVSAFPEGFPMVLISTLASGSYRMAKKNAIINRMSIIETLGETTVICSDKTGTITTGEMTAKKLYVDSKLLDIEGVGYKAEGGFWDGKRKLKQEDFSALAKIFTCTVLCNDAIIERTGVDKEYEIKGTPTEGALLIMSAKAGVFREDLKAARQEEIPFNSERKLMSVVCKDDKNLTVYSKGAPEVLIEKCEYRQKGKTHIKLSLKEKEEILKIQSDLAKDGLRVLALAYKPIAKITTHFEDKLVFLGLVGFVDPPREEVKQTLKLCKSAGIKVKMITGDYRETALHIAQEVGLGQRVLTGTEIDRLSGSELSACIDEVDIFARVKPEHKLKIVGALKANGEIVAMTGDGVNDAPAIKEAHIGIAMGKNGTDVSRETADLIIKDDNFTTIVSAIKEGRTIFSNIQKFVTYQLSCNLVELMIMFLGVLLGMPIPLLPLQILFMNLVTDNLPAITLGFNPSSLDIMKSKAKKTTSLLTKELYIQMIVAGVTMGLITLVVFYVSYTFFNQDVDTARTTALVTLIFFQILNAFNFRSLRYTMNKLPLMTNKYLIYASVVSILATVVIVHLPLNLIFETIPLQIESWLFALFASMTVVIVMDYLKKISNQKRKLAAG